MRPVRLKVPTDSIGMCLMPYALRVALYAAHFITVINLKLYKLFTR